MAAAAAMRQANSTSGNCGTDVLPDANDVYRTQAVWNDRGSLLKFKTAAPHLGMMGSLDSWCDEASFVEWEQSTPQMPEWPVAHDRLVRDGRSPTLGRPSPDHEARSFPPIVERYAGNVKLSIPDDGWGTAESEPVQGRRTE